MQTLDHERRIAARERQMLADATAKLHAREEELKNRDDLLRRRLDQKVNERLREARREIDAVVGRLKARTETMAAQAERAASRLVPTGESGGARAEARAALDAIEERLNKGDQIAAEATPSGEIERSRAAGVGDRVLVGPLQLEGVVMALGGKDAEVDVRGKRLRARLGQLRVVSPASASSALPKVKVTVDLQPREGSLSELNVIGCNVDDALTRAEKFLDDAVVTEQRNVRVIHGFGTGQLRRAISDLLRSHPFVASFGPAASDRGGGGVTVVELKE
jgi:DNA mismatch repair protein MutS2